MSSSKNSNIEKSNGAFLIKLSEEIDIHKSCDDSPSQRKQTSTNSSNSDNFSVNKLCNNGRWTDLEHLIFLACIMEFGRDWKKIEFYVHTRSSSQARSHAQKVLKKLDKSSILKEISDLKNKINFQPVEHKCEGLLFLNDSQADSLRDTESKQSYIKQKVEDDHKVEVTKEEILQPKNVVSTTPDVNSTKNIQFLSTIEKSKKSVIVTPQTCVSNNATPARNEQSSNKELRVNNNLFEKLVKIEKAKPCFRNLSESIANAEKIYCQQPNIQISEQSSKKLLCNQDEQLQSNKSEDYSLFDFGMCSVLKQSYESIDFEDLLSLNSLAKKSIRLFDDNLFYNDSIPMGDDKMPLWMQY